MSAYVKNLSLINGISLKPFLEKYSGINVIKIKLGSLKVSTKLSNDVDHKATRKPIVKKFGKNNTTIISKFDILTSRILNELKK